MLGVKADDSVRFIISEEGVHIEQAQSVPETPGALRGVVSIESSQK